MESVKFTGVKEKIVSRKIDRKNAIVKILHTKT